MTERPYREDVAHFLRASRYLVMAKPASALRHLKWQLEAGEECAAALGDYPALQIEPLEFFYTCLRNLGVLNRGFFEMLLFELTWRGVVWGAWLAMLEPREEFLAPLLSVRNKVSGHKQWIVDCAVCAIEGRAAAPGDEEFMIQAERVRRLLAPIPRPMGRLRRMPTLEERTTLDEERERIRRCYKAEGVDAARAKLPGTLVGYYAQDYPRWLRSLRPTDG